MKKVVKSLSSHGGNVREHAERLAISADRILDFSANINPLGIPDSLKSAISQQLELAECYPDIEYKALHQALADYHHCVAQQIIAGNGATELIFAITAAIKPKKAMLLLPGFAEYRRALQQQQCEIVNYSLSEANHFQPDSTFLNAISADLDCLFICSPNNPTGQRIDSDLLNNIVAVCRQQQVYLIVDEAFIDFAGEHYSLIPQLVDNPHLIVLRSMTKFFAIPGLRLGYLLNSNLVLLQQLKQQQQPWTINCFAELAGRTVLHDKAYIKATYQWLQQEQSYLFDKLSAFSVLTVYPPSANYIFFKCHLSDVNLQEALLGHAILIRSCSNYPGLDNSYYRVAIKDRHANIRLLTALNQILAECTSIYK